MLDDTDDNRIVIEPTSTVTTPEGERLYSDIALTHVYGQHALQVNSVRTVHWQIYAAMLLANSIIMGLFLVRIGNAYFQLFGGVIGFVFCILWFRIVQDNWSVFFRRCDEGARFFWRLGGELEQRYNRANVFFAASEYYREAGITSPHTERKRGGTIKDVANYLIALFMFVYVFFILLSFGRILGNETIIQLWATVPK